MGSPVLGLARPGGAHERLSKLLARLQLRRRCRSFLRNMLLGNEDPARGRGNRAVRSAPIKITRDSGDRHIQRTVVLGLGLPRFGFCSVEKSALDIGQGVEFVSSQNCKLPML